MVWSPPMATRCWLIRQDRSRASLDLRDGLRNGERRYRQVADIDDLCQLERLHIQSRMVSAQQPRSRSDRRRSKPRSRAIGHTGVEGHADDGDVTSFRLVAPWEAREGGGPREPWDDTRIDWSDGLAHGPSARARQASAMAETDGMTASSRFLAAGMGTSGSARRRTPRTAGPSASAVRATSSPERPKLR